MIAWARKEPIGDRYFLFHDKTTEFEIIDDGVLDIYGDGHPSYSPDKRWIVTDTYPDKARTSFLIVFDPVKEKAIIPGEFPSPWKFYGANRCDLYPRWSPDGTKMSIDSVHEDFRNSYNCETFSIEVESISGACLLVRSEVLDAISSLDENFFLYYEDIDLCLRAKKAGWENTYFSKSEVIHFVGQSLENVSENPFAEISRNKSICYYFSKHFSMLSKFIIKIMQSLVCPAISRKTKKELKSSLSAYFEALKYVIWFKTKS